MKIKKFVMLIFFITSTIIFAQNTKNEDLSNKNLKVSFINGYGIIYQSKLSNNSFYRLQTEFELKLADGDDDLSQNISTEWEYLGDFEVVYPFTKDLKKQSDFRFICPRIWL